ncbi:MAG: type II toxin-antitoxin system Phd/YefM family antitoxin [Candidatus Dormibacteria bacterium]
MSDDEYMHSVSHRELRNDGARILAAVKGGEIIEVTDRGEPTAILVPPATFRINAPSGGKLSTPEPVDRLAEISPVVAAESTQDVLDALRVER